MASKNTGGILSTTYFNRKQDGTQNGNFITWDSRNMGALGTGIEGDLYRGTFSEPQWLPRSNTLFNFSRALIRTITPDPEGAGELITTDKSSTIISLSPSYNPGNNKTIDGPITSRINMASPGRKGNIISYSTGKILEGQTKPIAVDQINALPIYRYDSTENKLKPQINDLIQFKIGAINSEDPNIVDYIHFRAFIDNFSDSYTSRS